MRFPLAMIALSAALVAALVCPAAGDDYHVSDDPAQRLFRLSPFAHGYIHGYESGFGMGDEDVQMGRGDQHVEKTGEYRSGDRGYQGAFGDRESFRAGFREGLTMGYRDAVSGGEFRALGELRRLASGLENDLVQNGADAPYDGGFLAGYRAARQSKPDECTGEAKGNTKARFCSGFLDGYELGEADSGALATAEQRNPTPADIVKRHAPRR